MAVKLIDELQKEIKAAGEAVTQEAYEKAYDHAFQILDNLEKLLNDNRYLEGNEITEEDKRLYDILIRFDAVYYFKQRLNRKAFLFGDYITDSDIRLYTTLARFDYSYSRNIGPCVHRLVDYKNLWPYARDLYQIPAFRHNTYFKDFAASEDLTHAPEDYWENVYYDIVVQETDWDTIWSQPTGREALSKDPAHKWKAEI